jgi:hypothetical protein
VVVFQMFENLRGHVNAFLFNRWYNSQRNPIVRKYFDRLYATAPDEEVKAFVELGAKSYLRKLFNKKAPDIAAVMAWAKQMVEDDKWK